MAALLVFTESKRTLLEHGRDKPGTLLGCGITERVSISLMCCVTLSNWFNTSEHNQILLDAYKS